MLIGYYVLQKQHPIYETNERTVIFMNEYRNLPEISTGGKVRHFFSVLCNNRITVSRTRPIFNMPIIAFLLIALLTFEISVPAILISLFCGVEYVLDGADFPVQKRISFKS